MLPEVKLSTFELYDSVASLSENWSSRVLYATDGILPTVNWGLRFLYNSGGGSYNWETGTFSDAQTFSSTITNSTLTVSRAVVTDASKVLVSSATTATEIGYVNGVTSAIQAQLDSKSPNNNPLMVQVFS